MIISCLAEQLHVLNWQKTNQTDDKKALLSRNFKIVF